MDREIVPPDNAHMIRGYKLWAFPTIGEIENSKDANAFWKYQTIGTLTLSSLFFSTHLLFLILTCI